MVSKTLEHTVFMQQFTPYIVGIAIDEPLVPVLGVKKPHGFFRHVGDRHMTGLVVIDNVDRIVGHLDFRQAEPPPAASLLSAPALSALMAAMASADRREMACRSSMIFSRMASAAGQISSTSS